MSRTRTSLWILAVALLLSVSSRGFGQAVPTATRNVGLSVFGGYQYVHPDYGPGYQNNDGVFFGADYSRFFAVRRSNLAASVELRFNLNSGEVVKEKSYLGGLKLEKEYGRIHPYGDFLIGLGTVHFNHFPTCCEASGANSVVMSYGGGIDYDLIRNFQAKADYQLSHWDLGQTSIQNPGQQFTLTPTLLSIGLKWNIGSLRRIY